MNKYCVLLLALALPACAADRIFTGSLERVGPSSISILMADGLRVDAVLPAGIPVPYQLADQVEIACTTAKTVYDAQAGKLRDFVADEINRRYRSYGEGKPWRLEKTIEDEITVKDNRVSHQNIHGGKPDGTDFGLHLNAVFDTRCPTKIEFAGRQEAGGKPVLKYFFSSPPDACFGGVGHNGNPFVPGVMGGILVDAAKGNVLRYEWEGRGFPEKFACDRDTVTESWAYAAIGGSSYLAPISNEVVLRMPDGSMERVTTEYKNHRHFEASTNVTFH